MPAPTETCLDTILAIQLAVAWAGEGRSEPRRLGWWDTDLVDGAGGGDLFLRLTPRTHAWTALEAVREAARRVDAKARGRLGDPDRTRTLFFLGFELDERIEDRFGSLKRQGVPPQEALTLPFDIGAAFSKDTIARGLALASKVKFKVVPPIGRQLDGEAPSDPAEMVRQLAAALLPFSDEYPLPFFQARS